MLSISRGAFTSSPVHQKSRFFFGRRTVECFGRRTSEFCVEVARVQNSSASLSPLTRLKKSCVGNCTDIRYLPEVLGKLKGLTELANSFTFKVGQGKKEESEDSRINDWTAYLWYYVLIFVNRKVCEMRGGKGTQGKKDRMRSNFWIIDTHSLGSATGIEAFHTYLAISRHSFFVW